MRMSLSFTKILRDNTYSQPQAVHMAAVWLKKYKYLLLRHLTTEQLCETPELILHSLPLKSLFL